MSRLSEVQKLLHHQSLSALIIDHPIDLYYLLGIDLSFGRLVVEETQATLFVDGRYYEACQGIDSIALILTAGYSKESAFSKWWHLQGKKVAFDAESTSYADYEGLKQLSCELVPLYKALNALREIKEKNELGKLKRAAQLACEGFDYLCSLLQDGITEKPVAKELEIFWLKRGGDRVSFAPHIAFAEGSAQPHYHASERPLKKGDLVLCDIGVVVDHYNSDMTRVVSYGTPPPQLEEIYQIV